ncbi:MAG: hypothetical protein AB8I08_01055 [Sandaracinaceae bacterium]
MRSFVALLCVLFISTGCSVVVDGSVDGLEPNPLQMRDVTVSLRDFSPHVEQLVRVEWVENLDLLVPPPAEGRVPLVLATAVIDSAPSDCMDIRMRRGAPLVANRVDFYADVNMNGMVDPPEDGDHTWREFLDDNGELIFIHDVQFEDLTVDPGAALLNGFEVEITGAEEHDGATATVLLIDEDTLGADADVVLPSVTVLYVTEIESGTLSIALPGVADSGEDYDIEVRIGDNSLVCTIDDQRTPVSGPLRVEGELSSFTCAPGEAPDCGGLSTACDAGDDTACADLAWQCAFVDCGR